VRDKTGDLVPRNALLQREKTLLSECLLYAMLISKVCPRHILTALFGFIVETLSVI
jgi:hypothetical protein